MDYRKQKYFGLAFMGRLTHEDLNQAGLVDPMVAKLFNKLFDQNLLSNTIIVFFSDHGIRIGPIRETLSGKLEEE
jgi:membrane-anchored protein YejM (alkaline phosphatase superfamily)